MKKLLEAIEKNEELKAKKEDFQPTKAQGELEEEELDKVAGGGICYCVLGGGGDASDFDKTCACVLVGAGEFADGFDADDNLRCMCPVAGNGEAGVYSLR